MLDKFNEKNYPVVVVVIGVILLLFIVNHGLVNQISEIQDTISDEDQSSPAQEPIMVQEIISSPQIDATNDPLAPVSIDMSPAKLLKLPPPSRHSEDSQEIYEPPDRNIILLQ